MKNRFTKFLEKDSVMILEGTTKREVLEELISMATIKTSLDVEVLRELTWKREKMMTTGVGHSLALPHIRVDGIGTPVVLCGVCKNPIEDYGSQDNEPVQIIIYLVGSSSNQEAYLELLGSISRKLRTPGIIEDILENITRPSQILRVLKRRVKTDEENDEGEDE